MSTTRREEITCDADGCSAVVHRQVASHWDTRYAVRDLAGWVVGVLTDYHPRKRLDFCPNHAGGGS